VSLYLETCAGYTGDLGAPLPTRVKYPLLALPRVWYHSQYSSFFWNKKFSFGEKNHDLSNGEHHTPSAILE
jgi:hypothetical protein